MARRDVKVARELVKKGSDYYDRFHVDYKPDVEGFKNLQRRARLVEQEQKLKTGEDIEVELISSEELRYLVNPEILPVLTGQTTAMTAGLFGEDYPRILEDYAWSDIRKQKLNGGHIERNPTFKKFNPLPPTENK